MFVAVVADGVCSLHWFLVAYGSVRGFRVVPNANCYCSRSRGSKQTGGRRDGGLNSNRSPKQAYNDGRVKIVLEYHVSYGVLYQVSYLD